MNNPFLRNLLYITFFMLCTKFLHRWQPKIHMVPPCSHARAKFRCLKQRNGSFFPSATPNLVESARKRRVGTILLLALSLTVAKATLYQLSAQNSPISVVYVSHARSMFYGFCFLERVAFKLHWYINLSKQTINGTSEQFLHCHWPRPRLLCINYLLKTARYQ